MDTAVLVDAGWVSVPYKGDEFARIELAVGDQTDWYPAYRDWSSGGVRVVKIRPPAGRAGPSIVWLKVDGHVTQLGHVTL